MAAASLGWAPWAALAAASDRLEAVALLGAGRREGREWLGHLLADPRDRYTHDLRKAVAGDPAMAAGHLAWLKTRLAERGALAGLAVRRTVELPAFRPEPDLAPGWREEEGAPPIGDPFVPKGWTYADWYRPSGREVAN